MVRPRQPGSNRKGKTGLNKGEFYAEFPTGKALRTARRTLSVEQGYKRRTGLHSFDEEPVPEIGSVRQPDTFARPVICARVEDPVTLGPFRNCPMRVAATGVLDLARGGKAMGGVQTFMPFECV